MTTYFPGILSTGALVPGLAAGTVRTTLGLGTADSPTFAGGTFTGQVVLPAGTVSLPSLQIGSFQTGFFEGTVGRLNLAVNGTQILEFRSNRVTIAGSAGLRFGSSTQLLVDTSNVLAQRNATNPQISEVYKTYTSATSNERLAFDTTAAGFYDIVAGRGSLGGAENGIRIGGKLDGGSFVPWLTFTSIGTGAATFTQQVTSASPIGGGGTFNFIARGPSDLSWGGGIQFTNANAVVYGSIIGVVTAGLRQTKTEFSGTITGRASTTAAGTAPIKIPAGVLMTTPEANAIEYDGANLYFTDSGGTRRQLAVV